MDISLSFHDIFTKICVKLLTAEYQRLAKVIFNFLFVCLYVGSFVPLKMGIFSWTFLKDQPQWNINCMSVCLSVGSPVYWKMENLDILLRFQDIFNKIGEHLLTDIFQNLAEMKYLFVCVSVSWFIYNAYWDNCSLVMP